MVVLGQGQVGQFKPQGSYLRGTQREALGGGGESLAHKYCWEVIIRSLYLLVTLQAAIWGMLFGEERGA